MVSGHLPTAHNVGFVLIVGQACFGALDGEDRTSIGSGTLDGPTGIETAKHIYVADKGDYYDLSDDLPKHDQ